MKKTLLLLGLLASCSAPSVSVLPAVIENSLTGSVSGTLSGGISGGNDVESLGLGDSDSVFSPRVDLNFLGSQISISNSSSAFSGSGMLGETGGGPLDVDTDIALNATRLLWTFNFVNTDTAHFGVGLGVTAFDLALLVAETGVPVNSFTVDEVLPAPLLGVRAGGDLGVVRIAGSIATFQIEDGDDEISVTDLDVYVGVDVIGDMGSLVVGYRSLELDASYEDDDVSVALDLGLGGPYFGLRLSF